MNTLESHPCFGDHCRPTGRIHLPVSPECNIRCRFCARAISAKAPRPGNAARVVTPGEAMTILERALRICPEIAVVGVAGPGDPLATSHAVETLTLAHQKHPRLMTCLSTNGLALPEYLPRLVEAGLQTLTVTVNAVNPPILARLCRGVMWRGEFLPGEAGAARLISAQREGIRSARALGLTIKVNLVLVPAVNGGHVGEAAKTVAAWGASYFNVIPLLPAAEFAAEPAPADEAVESAREAAEGHLAVFRHCRRCRADACGVPGVSDYARELYRDFRPVETFSHG
ncbi:MAG: radical SAM protein [Candidatus Adiutrix sp.]|jgi:nitrogen fixation protein NifB|nr:radical SAM protein [Candidatus Adiutrix sp.]